jgi:hypothetical protein
MRKPDTASGAPTKASLAASLGNGHSDAPVQLVCLALLLALAALALRIIAIW